MTLWDWIVVSLGTIGFALILAGRWALEVVKNIFTRRWFVFLAILLASPQWSSAAPPEFPGLRFVGCFEAKEIDPWTSPKRLGNGNCVAAVAPDGRLWIASQRARYLAPFVPPAVLSPDMPVWNAARQVHDCPVKATRAGDWVQWYDEPTVLSSIPAERFDGRGALFVGDRLAQSTFFFYNANVREYPPFWIGDTHRKATLNGQYVGGYLYGVPEPWATRLGYRVACGNHVHQQTGHAFLGPCFIGLDLASDPIGCKVVVAPPRSHWLYREPSGEAFRKADSNDHAQLAIDRARYDIEYTTRTTAAGILGDHLYFFGVLGTGKGWYGDRDAIIGGTPYRDLANTSKGYHNEGRAWACWAYPMSVVERCANGELQPHEAEALSTRIVFSADVTGQPVGETPLGCAVDYARNRLYLTVPLKLHSRSETTPLVLVYESVKKPAVVTFHEAPGAVRVALDGEPADGPAIRRLREWLDRQPEAVDVVRGTPE